MTIPLQPAADVISPAEAKFWLESAQKVPSLLRPKIAEAEVVPASVPYKSVGVGVGAVLGIATITPYVQGRWKWLTGLSGAAAVTAGLLLGFRQDAANTLGAGMVQASKQALLAYAADIESKPEVAQQLANHLSVTVKGDEMKSLGVDDALILHAHEFARQHHYLDTNKVAALMPQAQNSMFFR